MLATRLCYNIDANFCNANLGQTLCLQCSVNIRVKHPIYPARNQCSTSYECEECVLLVLEYFVLFPLVQSGQRPTTGFRPSIRCFTLYIETFWQGDKREGECSQNAEWTVPEKSLSNDILVVALVSLFDPVKNKTIIFGGSQNLNTSFYFFQTEWLE